MKRREKKEDLFLEKMQQRNKEQIFLSSSNNERFSFLFNLGGRKSDEMLDSWISYYNLMYSKLELFIPFSFPWKKFGSSLFFFLVLRMMLRV